MNVFFAILLSVFFISVILCMFIGWFKSALKDAKEDNEKRKKSPYDNYSE